MPSINIRRSNLPSAQLPGQLPSAVVETPDTVARGLEQVGEAFHKQHAAEERAREERDKANSSAELGKAKVKMTLARQAILAEAEDAPVDQWSDTEWDDGLEERGVTEIDEISGGANLSERDRAELENHQLKESGIFGLRLGSVRRKRRLQHGLATLDAELTTSIDTGVSDADAIRADGGDPVGVFMSTLEAAKSRIQGSPHLTTPDQRDEVSQKFQQQLFSDAVASTRAVNPGGVGALYKSPLAEGLDPVWLEAKRAQDTRIFKRTAAEKHSMAVNDSKLTEDQIRDAGGDYRALYESAKARRESSQEFARSGTLSEEVLDSMDDAMVAANHAAESQVRALDHARELIRGSETASPVTDFSGINMLQSSDSSWLERKQNPRAAADYMIRQAPNYGSLIQVDEFRDMITSWEISGDPKLERLAGSVRDRVSEKMRTRREAQNQKRSRPRGEANLPGGSKGQEKANQVGRDTGVVDDVDIKGDVPTSTEAFFKSTSPDFLEGWFQEEKGDDQDEGAGRTKAKEAFAGIVARTGDFFNTLGFDIKVEDLPQTQEILQEEEAFVQAYRAMIPVANGDAELALQKTLDKWSERRGPQELFGPMTGFSAPSKMREDADTLGIATFFGLTQKNNTFRARTTNPMNAVEGLAAYAEFQMFDQYNSMMNSGVRENEFDMVSYGSGDSKYWLGTVQIEGQEPRTAYFRADGSYIRNGKDHYMEGGERKDALRLVIFEADTEFARSLPAVETGGTQGYRRNSLKHNPVRARASLDTAQTRLKVAMRAAQQEQREFGKVSKAKARDLKVAKGAWAFARKNVRDLDPAFFSEGRKAKVNGKRETSQRWFEKLKAMEVRRQNFGTDEQAIGMIQHEIDVEENRAQIKGTMQDIFKKAASLLPEEPARGKRTFTQDGSATGHPGGFRP